MAALPRFLLLLGALAGTVGAAGDARQAWLQSLANTPPLVTWSKRVGADSTSDFFTNGPYWIDGTGTARKANLTQLPLGAFKSVHVDGTLPVVRGAEVVASPSVQVTCSPQPGRPTLALAFVQLTQLRGPNGTSREITISGSPMPGQGSKRAAAEARVALSGAGSYMLRSILVASCADASGRDELFVVPVITSVERP